MTTTNEDEGRQAAGMASMLAESTGRPFAVVPCDGGGLTVVDVEREGIKGRRVLGVARPQKGLTPALAFLGVVVFVTGWVLVAILR
jgi:hypothetical protein